MRYRLLNQIYNLTKTKMSDRLERCWDNSENKPLTHRDRLMQKTKQQLVDIIMNQDEMIDSLCERVSALEWARADTQRYLDDMII